MKEKKKTGHPSSADLRKRAEEALRESEERYRRLIETAPDVIYNLSAEDGTFTLLNPAFERITGWSRAEWLGKPFMPLVHPDDLTLAREAFQQVSRGESIPPYELRILSKSGEYLIGEFTSFPHIEKRKVLGEFGIARDITERKRAEEEIQSLAKFPAENPDPILRIARDGTLLYINQAGLNLLPEWHLQVGQAAPPMLREAVLQVLDNGSTRRLDLEHLRQIYSFSIVPIVDAGYANLYARDVTERRKAEKALRESREKYRNLFETTMQGIVYQDASGLIISANRAAERILGLNLDQMQGRTSTDPRWRAIHEDGSLFPGEEHPSMVALRTSKIVSGVIMGVYHPQTNGTRWILIDAIPKFLPGETKPIQVYTTFTDITERKRAEEGLKKSSQLLRDTGEMAKVGGWELDLSTKEVIWTEEVHRIHGVAPGYKPKLEEAINFYAPESRPALEEAIKKAAETGEPYDLESLFIPSGSKNKIWVRSLGKAVYSGDKIIKLAGTFQNIDKYKRAEAALRKYEARLRTLSLELSHAEERERRRLALFLHDEIGQSLALLRMKLGEYAGGLELKSGKHDIGQICDVLEKAIDQTHTLTFELSPPILHQLGLEAAIEWAGEKISQDQGIDFIFNDDGRMKPLDVDLKAFLFRCVRELMMNIVKHAKARRMTVSLTMTQNQVCAVVEDNGIGFDTSLLERQAEIVGFGLFSIRERLAAVDGTFELRSEAGRGTRVALSIPVK